MLLIYRSEVLLFFKYNPGTRRRLGDYLAKSSKTPPRQKLGLAFANTHDEPFPLAIFVE